ncbi:MAG: hypothetical protein J6S57_03510 [Alphaproteobacteria bacterium]|nr:hypothetical protein [Alphaproteobacteria bacterium]
MANKKLKIFALGAAMAASGLMSSCGNKNAQNNSQDCKEEKIEVVAKPKTKTPSLYEQKRDYRRHVYDSVNTANGGRDLEAQLAKKPSEWEYWSDSIEKVYPYTLGGAMDKEVETAGAKIIENSYKQIVDELAKYKVKISVDYLDNNYLKIDMYYVGVINDEYDYANEEWQRLTKNVFEIIDSADYGDGPKQNMKDKVTAIVEKAQQDLIASRKSVEQKYADFYLVSDDARNYLAIVSEGEGEYSFGYADLNYYNSKYKNVERYVDVYDSKLTVDFFGEKDAKYKLVSLGDGKWQVVKKSKNGTVSKTHVFEDKKDFSTCDVFSNEPDTLGRTEFNFEPGYNYGVRVYSREIVNVQKRKKDWSIKLPKDVQQSLDSLIQDFNEQRAIQRSVWEKNNEADSIANIMVNQKFGQIER